MDATALSALIISIITALSSFFSRFKHCQSCCCESDCVSNSNPSTPTNI